MSLTGSTELINSYQSTFTIRSSSYCIIAIYRVGNLLSVFIVMQEFIQTKREEMRLCLCDWFTHPVFPVSPHPQSRLVCLSSPLMGKPVPEGISSQAGENMYLTAGFPWNI